MTFTNGGKMMWCPVIKCFRCSETVLIVTLFELRDFCFYFVHILPCCVDGFRPWAVFAENGAPLVYSSVILSQHTSTCMYHIFNSNVSNIKKIHVSRKINDAYNTELRIWEIKLMHIFTILTYVRHCCVSIVLVLCHALVACLRLGARTRLLHSGR